jgi:hypothetical protein
MEVLDRKANAIPQQLQNYSIKQFKESTVTDKQAKQASTLPPMDKDQEIARLRKELALLKLQKGEAVAKPANQTGSGGAKATTKVDEVDVLARRRPAEQPPKAKRADKEAVSVERSDRKSSAGQTDSDSDSRTAVITVDQGRRRRSSANTPTGRSSSDSSERHRENRYHSARKSNDLGRRDFYVVQVTEPQPRPRKGSKEVSKFKEVTVYHKEARYTAAH